MRFILRLILIIAVLWGAGLAYYVASIPAAANYDTTHTDGMVVLTGGPDRISNGLTLFAKGWSDRLLISGVGSDDPKDSFIRQHAPQAIYPSLKQDTITLDRVADSTYTNAFETAKWSRKHNIKSLRVVTSEFHMPRSLLVLQDAMQHVTLIAHAVPSKEFSQGAWWKNETARNKLLREYHKYLWVAFYRL